MKAFILDRYGSADRVRAGEVPDPELRENDVLVQIHSAGVNLLDSKIRNGEFKLFLRYRLPFILGHDVAGVVVRVGSRVRRFKPGDEVVVEMPAVKIQNPVAVFAGLDKITGRIIAFDVKLNEKVQFGALQVTPRVCFTRPTNEAANTDGFIDVDEVTLQGETKRLFTGWMFAASPGLHAVEHPIYDVWLTGCKGGQTVVADTQPVASGPTQSTPPGGTQRAQQPPAGGGASPPSGTPPKPPAGSAASPPAGTPPKPSAQQRQSAQQPQGQGAPQPVAQAPAARQPPPPPPPAQSPFQFQWPPRQ